MIVVDDVASSADRAVIVDARGVVCTSGWRTEPPHCITMNVCTRAVESISSRLRAIYVYTFFDGIARGIGFARRITSKIVIGFYNAKQEYFVCRCVTL